MPYVIAVLVAVVIGVGFTLFQSNKSVVQTPTPATVTETVSETPAAVATFKDGTFITDVKYRNPKQTEYAMNVSLTLANGVVTDSKIVYAQGAEKDPNAQRFEAAYKNEVIGKSLENISISRVGGASLTTNAFNNALSEIKTQAQS